MYELDSRFTLCGFEPTLDSNDCCEYYLPPQSGHWYIVDGNHILGGRVLVCAGEEVTVEHFESAPKNPSGIRKICSQVLTCTCCDAFDLGYSAEHLDEPSEFAGCCRITLEFNNPSCTGTDLILRGIIPDLGPDATIEAQQSNSMIICGHLNGTSLELVAGIPNLECVKRKTIQINHCN